MRLVLLALIVIPVLFAVLLTPAQALALTPGSYDSIYGIAYGAIFTTDLPQAHAWVAFTAIGYRGGDSIRTTQVNDYAEIDWYGRYFEATTRCDASWGTTAAVYINDVSVGVVDCDVTNSNMTTLFDAGTNDYHTIKFVKTGTGFFFFNGFTIYGDVGAAAQATPYPTPTPFQFEIVETTPDPWYVIQDYPNADSTEQPTAYVYEVTAGDTTTHWLLVVMVAVQVIVLFVLLWRVRT
mgnify:CR=1 FL=1